MNSMISLRLQPVAIRNDAYVCLQSCRRSGAGFHLLDGRCDVETGGLPTENRADGERAVGLGSVDIGLLRGPRGHMRLDIQTVWIGAEMRISSRVMTGASLLMSIGRLLAALAVKALTGDFAAQARDGCPRVTGRFPRRELLRDDQWSRLRAMTTSECKRNQIQLAIHTIDTAPEASRPILQAIASDLGMLPNFAASIASSPTLLGAFDGMRRAVGAGELDPAARETAGVAVDNRYGVAFHSTVLGRLGVEDAEIERMRGAEQPSDARLAAAYGLARTLAVCHGKVDPEVLARAEAWYSTSEILEIVAETLFASLVGVVDHLAGGVELDGFLRPRAWS